MKPGMNFKVEEADLGDEAQARNLVEILDTFAREPGGQGAPLSDRARSNLVKGLRNHPTSLVLLAWVGEEPVGTAVCVWGFSTFAGKPFINVHDLTVLPAFRGRGIGRGLLDDVERRARERECCKVTLEVHDGNERAKKLYRSVGFGPWNPATLFVAKQL